MSSLRATIGRWLPARLRGWLGRTIDKIGEATALALLKAMCFFVPTPKVLPADGARRVVFVGPHPDDEYFAGGTLAAHRQAGAEVTIIILTDGSGSAAGGLSPGEMVARRKTEMENAANALGANLLRFNLPERDWDINEAARLLRPHLESSDLIYGLGPIDFHPDHIQTAHMLAKVIGDGQQIRLCESQVLLTPLLVNVVVPLTPQLLAARESASRAHLTQAYTVAAVRRKHHLSRRSYASTPLEVFWQVDGATLRRAMSVVNWTGHPYTPFRGIRPRGLSDPLGVLAGSFARLRLRRAAKC